ncbi:MAG: DUF3127 domain-containing protein [Bacteroidia bacterium]|nr:DUF3127 domain-containing protein [Bacteroidia bacterium]
MQYEIEGELVHVGEIEAKTDTFKIMDFVIKTEDQYPQFIKMQAVNKTCDGIKALGIGSKINCHFNLKGREYNEKYYTTISCWKYDIRAKVDKKEEAVASSESRSGDSDDDLPF